MELTGKTLAFLGDSITEGVGVTDLANRFDNRLLKSEELKAVYNYGVGGSRLAHQRVPSENPRHDLCFCGRAYDLNKETDLIVVFGGVNDYFHGDAPFGALTDRTPATFCGAVDFLMRFLPEQYPNAKTVFLTPAHGKFYGCSETAPSPEPNKLPDAKPLIDYVSVILAKGKEYGIPVLNLFEKLGINPNRESDFNTYTADGVHLNDAGHGRLAACVAEFLHNLA